MFRADFLTKLTKLTELIEQNWLFISMELGFFTCETCNNWKTTELPPIHIEQNQKYNDKRIADHTKSDFIDLVKKDMEELDIEFIDGKPLKPLKCN